MLGSLNCLKYAKCTKARKLCVNMLQSLLDKTYKKYKKKVKEDKMLLATVIVQLLQNKKILKQANKRAQQKALYLANKIVELEELDPAKELNCPAASISISALLTTQGALGLIKKIVANYSTCTLISSNL